MPDTARPPLRPGSPVAECAACGKRFTRVYAFDRHRVGDPDQRRCLTPAEMRERGMGQNARGEWRNERRVPAATVKR
jgi:hypothetical protein